MNRNLKALAALAVVYTGFATPAFAYLDGGTASIIVQGLIAGVATVMVFGRTQLYRVKQFFTRGRGAPKQDGE